MNTLGLNNASPEQQILISKILPLLVGVKTVTPLYYKGVIAGSEFVTYSAKKLYICLQLNFDANIVNSIATCYVDTFDESNTGNFRIANQTVFYDSVTTVPRFLSNQQEIKNIYFSRIDNIQIFEMMFIGYKVTIP